MVVPTRPTANLVMTQTNFAFAFLQPFLDTMSLRMGTHDFRQRHFGAGSRQRVPCLRLLFYRADDDQAFHGAQTSLTECLHLGADSLHFQRSFRAGANFQFLPAVVRLSGLPSIGSAKRRFAFSPC